MNAIVPLIDEMMVTGVHPFNVHSLTALVCESQSFRRRLRVGPEGPLPVVVLRRRFRAPAVDKSARHFSRWLRRSTPGWFVSI